MPSPDNFTTLYAVPMECNACVDSVSRALDSLKGVETVNVDLAQQLVSVYGHAAPSSVVKTIQETGRDAIIRGTGKPNSAAVCILESFEDADIKTPVKGLVRVVSVSEERSLFDITLNGLEKGTYFLSIRSSGDLSRGPLSTGDKIASLGFVTVSEPNDPTNELLRQLKGFSGQTFTSHNVSISSLIGRSIVVSQSEDEVKSSSLVGIIARSAGVWENLKSVCTCSGKTVWQEREDARGKGVN